VRKVRPGQIAVFALLFTLAVALAAGATWLLLGRVPLGDFRGVVLVIAGVILFYAAAILVFRVFLKLRPLPRGPIQVGSPAEFTYHVYLLFFLMIFYPVMFSAIVPVPLMRVFYQALGARMGPNTFSGGVLFDPPFLELGANTIVGQRALVIPHVIEGDRLEHHPIRMGDNVTIGAHAIVMSDVEIGDGAIVSAAAVVSKGTRIGAGEVWGGVPARRLK
jgi:acetyltransferase-like isoleucine patch superfamily enzyme